MKFLYLQVTGREATVFFLDYGNSETVAVGNIKELKENFRALPAQALRCSLADMPAAGSWNDEVSIAFEEMVMDKLFAATIIDRNSSGRY